MSSSGCLDVDFGHGRKCKMQLLFPSKTVRRIFPDADEEDFDPYFQTVIPNGYIPVDDISSEMLDPRYDFECPDARDDRIFGDEDDDPVNPNSDPLDILLARLPEEDNEGSYDRWCNEDYFFWLLSPFFKDVSACEDYHDADGITFTQSSRQCFRAPEGHDLRHYHLHHKVTYGPNGEHITRYRRIGSHGIHGRKPSRPKHVTVRGACVRADIICSSRRGPRCVGLVATPRNCKGK